jgi:glycosyltransferase involved in cell wall biosynthesis
MLISIIVATFNRPERLENALKSISLQEGARFEVIVVNDGGADVSEIVARWSRAMSVRYVQLPVNAGLARARNAAIREARGDVVAFLDDDDVMLAGHLRAGVQELADSDDVDAVYTQVALCDEFIAPGAVPTANQIKAHYRAAFDERLLLICNFMPVNAVFVRRREDVPILFDEELPQLEDWDLWLRLHLRCGYRFRAVPLTTTVYHRVPGFRSMTNSSHTSADEAMRFRDTFRKVIDLYPSDDGLVRQGRALHDHFYTVVANVSSAGHRDATFAYERFVEWMAAFAARGIDATTVRARIDSLLGAST